MREIYVDNYTINGSVLDILKKVQSELINGKLSVIEQKSDQIMVTCPVHKDGRESKPSCFIYVGDGNIPVGTFHCFTCDTSGDLVKFISLCFDKSYTWAKEWLISNFGETYSESELDLEDIKLDNKVEEPKFDMSVFDKFESYHPYRTKRKLTDEVIKEFEVKYDPDSKSIVFPVRNSKGEMSFLTKRSVEGRKFYIDKGADKSEVYLLYNILRNNLDDVYICESQINALTLEGYGYNAVAMIGSGCTDDQIDRLNNTNVRHFILALDNDPAGIKGNKKLCYKLSKDKFVDVVLFKDNRDINDLTREEFDSLDLVDRSEYISLQRS